MNQLKVQFLLYESNAELRILGELCVTLGGINLALKQKSEAATVALLISENGKSDI
jgi:hypothetical protein